MAARHEFKSRDASEGSVTLRFADERARVTYETVQEVARVAADLPADGTELKTRPITVAPEDRQRGLAAILAAGTVVFTGRKRVVLVPERSLTILQMLGMPYTIASARP